MSGDEGAFLRAILAASDDPVPKLVYADRLDERGDPRGEAVRLLITLDDPELADADRRRADARLRRLVARHGGPFAGAALLRGGWQRCSARPRRITGRVFDLTGVIAARVGFKATAEPLGAVVVDGVPVPCGGDDGSGWRPRFDFLLRAGGARAAGRVETNFAFGLPFGSLAFYLDDVLIYAEG